MRNLVLNELGKIALRIRTWVMASIIVIILLISAILVHNHQHAQADWRQQLLAQDAQSEQALSNPHNFLPHAAREAITASLEVNKYDLAHNLPPGHVDAWSYADDGLAGASIAVVFATVIAGDVVAGEFATGTIKALLTQPVTRSKILASKYIAVLLTTFMMIAIVFVSCLLIGGLFFGFTGAAEPHIYTNDQQVVTKMATGSYALIGYAFEFISGIMTITIAFMISTVFRSSALSIAISIITLFVGTSLVQLLSSYSWDKYILFANTDLMQYITGGPTIAGTTMGFSILMLIAYFIVLNVISWRVFVRRDVAA